jgi:CheY-like chemotaxis protein
VTGGKPDKPVVLAVDDTPENLDVVKGILANDYTVKAAINGEMALKIVEKSPPDIILLDIMMPGMSGYEVCEQLKADSSTRDIPVIFLTAMEQTTDEARGGQNPPGAEVCHGRSSVRVCRDQKAEGSDAGRAQCGPRHPDEYAAR